MNPDTDAKPAGGQTTRLPGASRDAALHDQLFRYAQDMQELLDSHNDMEQRYRTLRESYESVAEGHTVLEGLIHASHDIYLMTDRAGTILRCNPAAGAIAPVAQLLGVCIGDLLAPSHLERFRLLLEQLEDGAAPPPEGLELHLESKGSQTGLLIAMSNAMPVRISGDLRGVHWMLRDITRASEAEFESKISSLVFSSAAEGVLITDCEGDILAVNPAFSKITGYSAEEAVGSNPRFLQSGIQNRDFYEKMWRALLSEGHWQGQISNRRKDGQIYAEWLALTSARDSDGKVLSYIGVFSDLSRLVNAEKHLFHLAQHDALTQLSNHQLLQDRLQQAIALAKRRGEIFTLLYIELDRFEQINDSPGHPAGDLALQEIAACLSASIRAVDTVARLGGDQFAIVAPGLAREEDIRLFASKIASSLQAPKSIEGRDITIGASIGSALYPDHGEDAQALLRHAEMAMHQAKRLGGNSHSMYCAEDAATAAKAGGDAGAGSASTGAGPSHRPDGNSDQ